MKKFSMFLSALVLASAVFVSSAGVAMAAPKSSPEFILDPKLSLTPTTSIGKVVYYSGIQSCSLDTTRVTVAVSKGFANTVYQVSAKGAVAEFKTDRKGNGSVNITVYSPAQTSEYTKITLTANGLSYTSDVELLCSVAVDPAI